MTSLHNVHNVVTKNEGEEMEIVNSYKYLCILIDDSFTFKSNVL